MFINKFSDDDFWTEFENNIKKQADDKINQKEDERTEAFLNLKAAALLLHQSGLVKQASIIDQLIDTSIVVKTAESGEKKSAMDQEQLIQILAELTGEGDIIEIED